jgi:hypothetical protein
MGVGYGMTKRSQELYDRVLQIIEQGPKIKLNARDIRAHLSLNGGLDRFSSARRIEKMLWQAARDSRVAISWHAVTGPYFVKL